MRTRSTTIIAAGILVAILGALTVVAYAGSVRRGSGDGPKVTAWTASANIDAGTKGDDVAKVIRRINVPKTLVPQTAIAGPDALTGRIAVRPITQGEVITAGQFGVTGNATAPAAGLQIPPGTNAMTISMPLPQAVGRFVQSGDLVNIFATMKSTDPARPGATTKLLLSNVLVLANAAAGTPGDPAARLNQSSGGEILLTLALTPPDAERVVLVKETASMWFTLVRPGDGAVTTPGQTTATVLGR